METETKITDQCQPENGADCGRLDAIVMPDLITFKNHSVFKGEIPFLTFAVDGIDGGPPVEVGKLWGTGGKLSFEGDLEKSAEIFFEQVIELNRAKLEA